MGSIIIALPKLNDSRKISSLLGRYGMDTFAICSAAASVLSNVNQLESGVVICGHRFPDMSSRELSGYLPDNFQMVLMTSKDNQIRCPEGVMTLIMPCKPSDIVNTVNMVLEQQNRIIRKKIVEQKGRKRDEHGKNYVNNAKLLLMERNDMTEPEAYHYIQKCSMDSGNSMVETAQMILYMAIAE